MKTFSGKQKSGEQDKIILLLREILKDVLKTKENGHRWKIGGARNKNNENDTC